MKNKKLGRPNFSREKLGQPNNNSLEEFREQKGTISQNNVMDQSGETFHQIVPEQSSSTSSSITINGELEEKNKKNTNLLMEKNGLKINTISWLRDV